MKGKYDVYLKVSLYDWNEALTYDQITTTLSVVSLFLESQESGTLDSQFSSCDQEIIYDWMTRNCIDTFVDAQIAAEKQFLKDQEQLQFARHLMTFSHKRQRSH